MDTNSEEKVVATLEEAVKKFGGRYGVSPDIVPELLRKTAFKKSPDIRPISDEEMQSLMIVANTYDLNPFTSQIYALYNPVKDSFIPVVGVDGWLKMVNAHEAFDGMEFEGSGTAEQRGPLNKTCDTAITCKIFRKDRSHPTSVTEYLDECYANTEAWNTKPRRQLRHKSLVQAARYAFNFTGIYDHDEAMAIIASGMAEAVIQDAQSGSSSAVDSSRTVATHDQCSFHAAGGGLDAAKQALTDKTVLVATATAPVSVSTPAAAPVKDVRNISLAATVNENPIEQVSKEKLAEAPPAVRKGDNLPLDQGDALFLIDHH